MAPRFRIDFLVRRLTMKATPQAKEYHRRKMLLGAAGVGLEFAFFGVVLASGLSAAMGRWALRFDFQSPWLHAALYLAFLGVLNEIVFFPLSYARGHWLERKYGLSRQTTREWLSDHAKSVALNAVLMLLLTEILYTFVWGGGRWWWLWTAGAFTLVFVALARLAPVLIFPLFFKFKPIAEGELRERLARLAERAGTAISGIYEMNLSSKSRTVNAALAGLGRTRRIILADTLLERFPVDEVEIVIAHELGHHLKAHLLKGMALQTAMIFLFLWLVDLIAAPAAARLGFAGLGDVGAFPLLALVGAALGVALMPVTNAILRGFERQADRYAIEATGRPETFLAAMRRLGSLNMADPSPHPLVEALFYSHPSIQRRLELCEEIMASK
ncbi:MAG: M48 family metallopeptidase [Candidatus Sumerlaeota bacterium]|nr:M48 family metallopeptidase [Candidatus Sumerlaeota bacterium]